MTRFLALMIAVTLSPGYADPQNSSHAPRAPEAGVPDRIRRAQEDPPPPDVANQAPAPRDVAKDDNLEERAGVAKLVWGTKLGRMYSDYLFGKRTPEETLRSVHRLVERLFSNVLLSMNRVSGIQLMTEDVYNTGRVDPVINDRIGLLLLNISLKRHALEVEAAKQIHWQMPAIAFVGFLTGSSLVRRTVNTLVGAARRNAMWLILRRGRQEAWVARRAVRQLDFRGLLSWTKVRENYSDSKAIAGAASAFFLYTPIYFQVKAGSSDSATPTQKVIIYGVDQWLDLTNL